MNMCDIIIFEVLMNSRARIKKKHIVNRQFMYNWILSLSFCRQLTVYLIAPKYTYTYQYTVYTENNCVNNTLVLGSNKCNLIARTKNGTQRISGR